MRAATRIAPRRGSCRRLREEIDELIDRHRLAEEKSLDVVAAPFSQELQLIAVLDPLGDHLHVEIVRQIDDRPGDRSTTTARRQVTNERSRHLHAVELKM